MLWLLGQIDNLLENHYCMAARSIQPLRQQPECGRLTLSARGRGFAYPKFTLLASEPVGAYRGLRFRFYFVRVPIDSAGPWFGYRVLSKAWQGSELRESVLLFLLLFVTERL